MGHRIVNHDDLKFQFFVIDFTRNLHESNVPTFEVLKDECIY